MVETKALIVEMYIRFLADGSEEEYWKDYNKICFNVIEEEKRKKYNPNDIFKNDKKEENITSENVMIKVEDSFFRRLIDKIKRIFRK